MRWEMFIGHAVVVLSALAAIVTAVCVRLLEHRDRRRSPLHGKQLGHVPGQQLIERVAHHQDELTSSLFLMLFALPLMFMVWEGLRIDWHQVRFGVVEGMFAFGVLAVFGYGLRDYRRHYKAREQAKDGLLAERMTGMQLNRLAAQGCVVMHDLPCEGFNIDHVVIAPRGVYAVETKSFRKPKGSTDDSHYKVRYDGTVLRFPDFIEKDAVPQAERQAHWLRCTLRESLGDDIPVIPAVALPGWLIENSQEVWMMAPVKVFTPMGGGANFMAKEIDKLDPTQRALIAKALALRYPVVATS